MRIAVAPSTVMLFSLPRLPLMLKPPLVRLEKLLLLKLPPTTPAFSPATPIGLRPLKAICSMSFASIVFRSAASVCSGDCSAVTVTSSVSAPVSRVKSSASDPAASSCTFERLTFLSR